ncbi:hypothetical protein MTP99_015697 [Tenebrio molitor]|nr:hypothetical protein MTP99_015697 [Tenebrio molitor]
MSSFVIEQQIESLLNFLKPFLSLANCHMVDFFTLDSYRNFIPKDIHQEIHKIGERNITNLIFQDDFSCTPNLKNFVETASNYNLKNCKLCLNMDSLMDQMRVWGCGDIDKFKLEIFMTAKKSHEVEILSAVAASISKIANTSHVVDLGDGKGYLSSMLAFRHSIAVLGVDACNSNTCGAIKRANKLSKIWNGISKAPHRSVPKKTDKLSSINLDLYKQATQFVDENFNLEKLVVDTFTTESSSLRLGLIGLHTCGNLSPNSLKIFCKNDSVRSLCNVGCCYHLLTERFESNNHEFGFPLSTFLSDKKIVIGRSARMIANQSVERVLEAKQLPNISIFYRALLQVLLEQYCNELPTKHVGKFRKRPANFTEYVREALRRLEVDITVSDQQIEEIFSRYENRIDELNVFYLLRCKLSPVIESLILLDRLLFLHERGFSNSILVQFFDPIVSPRCYGIVALKELF